MDAQQIRRLGPLLDDYLAEFADCFGRADTRGHLPVYVRGLLSNEPRKSVEPIALAAGLAPRTLQQFLSLLDWDHPRLRQRLQQLVVRDHASPQAIGLLDETACPKKGTKTPGVQRQYCGATGKIDNCTVTVHLGYAVGDFHCLLDSDLYLPQSWDQDRPRCRAAGIPDEVVYRPKWRIALELLERATAHGVRFAWLTFDEGYGGKPEFLRALHRRTQRYVAEVPTTFLGWLRPPRLQTQGRRLRSQRAARSVADWLRYSPKLRDQPWVAYRVKDGHKGPMVWEAKRVRFFPQTDDGDPAVPVQLVVARNVLEPEKVKYFVSNAPAGTRIETLLQVAFSRWRVERCFEDEKTELGLAHYEGRNYTGLLRHQWLTAVAHLFLARVTEKERGKKSGADGVPGADGAGDLGAVVVVAPLGAGAFAAADGGQDPSGAARQRRGAGQPQQAHAAAAPRPRHSTHQVETL
jgi:SRSO17 transposase